MAPIRIPQRERQRRSTTAGADKRFYIDPSVIPEGFDYNWKRITCKGEQDTEHQIDLAENGWTPVPAERHRDKAGQKAEAGSMIIRGGLVLMERPTSITEEAQEEDETKAKDQLRTQFARLGQTDRGALPREVRKAKRSFASPDDAA